MKKTLLIAATLTIAGFGQTVTAGSLADPVIEAPLIIEDASSSSSGTSMVLALAVLLSIPVLTD